MRGTRDSHIHMLHGGDKFLTRLGIKRCSVLPHVNPGLMGGAAAPGHPWMLAGQVGWPRQVALGPWVLGGRAVGKE